MLLLNHACLVLACLTYLTEAANRKSTTKSIATTSKRTTSRVSSTTTSSSVPPPLATTCNASQNSYCTSQTQNTCLCKLDVDGVTPICSNGAACPQSGFPNPPPPCQSDHDCLVDFPGSVYQRCVYTDNANFCSPTYCATELGCNQNYGKVRRDGNARRELSEMKAEGIVRRMVDT